MFLFYLQYFSNLHVWLFAITAYHLYSLRLDQQGMKMMQEMTSCIQYLHIAQFRFHTFTIFIYSTDLVNL